MNNSTENYGDATDDADADTFISTVKLSVGILWKVFMPCLLLVGGFGNVATIFVLHRTKDRSSSQHVFLIALALADITVLATYVFPRFLDDVIDNVKLRKLHSVLCKLYYWSKRVTFQLSAWLVTAVTVQRTLAIKWPHKIRVMCTVRRTWTVVAVFVFVSCVYYSYLLVIYKVQNNRCFYHSTGTYQFVMQHLDTWLNMFLNSFLPFVCLLVCDVILSLSLFQASSSTSVSNQAISNAPSVKSDNSRRETAMRTTIMILVLSISFIVLTLPVRIVSIVYRYRKEEIDRNPRLLAIIIGILYQVTRLLVCINSVVNFFLYCFTGTRFRKEFLNWIRCSDKDPSSGSVWKTASGSSKGEITHTTIAHKTPG